ncbi:MAG: Gfo/Idh/MocA family oxidoreductase [Clostridia bacterium]|nr:Gfo/Idh/MocA family oxidoreductase [Clostridia bacterium]
MKAFRVAVIGCGAISGNHINGILAAGQTVCALCDIDPAHAEEKAAQYGLKDIKIYTDYVEMLDREQPDSVHICTPHYLHAPMCVEALGRNINVLCEKPLSINMDQLHAVLKAEKESRAQLGVCQQNRFEPNMLWLMDFIKEHGVKSALGIVSWERNEKYYRSAEWRGTILEEGGGVMINQALHTLDLMQHLCGMPTHVTSHIANDFHKDYTEVEDTTATHFDLADGMRFEFFATTAATGNLPVQLQFVTKDGKCVVAANDFVVVDGKQVEIEDTRKASNMVGKAVWGTGHAILIEEFYRCIREGEPFRIPGTEGAKVIQLILSMYHSHGNRIKTMC